MHDYQLNNPFRELNWRHRRTLDLVDHVTAQRCTRADDAYIRDYRKFFIAWNRLPNHQERIASLYHVNPAIFHAYELYLGAEREPDLANMLQARLLAGQDDATIATTLGTLPGTVDYYERLFFNVRDRLVNRDWITNKVLIPAIANAPIFVTTSGRRDPAAAAATTRQSFLDSGLKFFAYFGGPLLVDFLISGFAPGNHVRSVDDISGWLDNQFKLTLKRRVASAALLFEVNKYNLTELMTVYTSIMSIERAANSGDDVRNSYVTNVKTALDSIQWTVGRDGKMYTSGTPLEAISETVVELRDSQLSDVFTGKLTHKDLKELESIVPNRKNNTIEATQKVEVPNG